MSHLDIQVYFRIPWTIYFVARIKAENGQKVSKVLLGLFTKEYSPSLGVYQFKLLT